MSNKDILLVTDADNTLWDTNAAYAQAQLALLSDVEELVGARTVEADRLSFLRRIDEKIAAGHARRWKYPPRLLVDELAQALLRSGETRRRGSRTSTSKSEADGRAVKIASEFLSRVAEQWPALRPGVKCCLQDLKSVGARVVVATEEDAERCQSILEHYRLRDYIEEIASGNKSVSFFRDIGNRFGGAKQLCFSVGDQLDRDVAPAKLAGFVTILFPGGFRPTIRQHEDVEPDFVVHSYSEVVRIVRRYARRPRPLEKVAS